MNQKLLSSVYISADSGLNAFCRFITNNDTGKTGAHQSGFYLPKNAVPMLFDSPGVKGSNKDRNITIRWQDSFETESRLIYYGSGTRNEYRLTRFGRGFPFFNDEYSGSLLILIQMDQSYYCGYVLSDDEDIEAFFEKYNLSPTNLGNIFTGFHRQAEIIRSYAEKFDKFPSTKIMGELSHEIYQHVSKDNDPDKKILRLITIEFDLFKALEERLYQNMMRHGFNDINSMITLSNEILNRRKSRAGKALEHHLSSIFTENALRFEEQVVTEDSKKPDFIFPGSKEYHDFTFPADKLTSLAAKTTCKDRWRQILNEADRIETKHLFTLQQGISSNQLREMTHENVRLVVPKNNLGTFAPEFQSTILTLQDFITSVKSQQS